MHLTVLLAHSGRALELDCAPDTRVEEVQEALAGLTGLEIADQILTYGGSPLASGATLGSHGLPYHPSSDTETKPRDVFLYSRQFLRLNGPLPAPEILPDNEVQFTAEASRFYEPTEPHPLDVAPSPMLRAFPEYARQFRRDATFAAAAASAGGARIELCCRLVNEAEVQALGVDSAMASVEPHYAYICGEQSAFKKRYTKQYAIHADVLSNFQSDADFLRKIEFPPALISAMGEGKFMRLSDVVDLEELGRIAAQCERSHQSFARRVEELSKLHAALQTDVEALFMRLPNVDLDDLSQGLASAQAAANEQTSIAQALAADSQRADAALEEAANEAAKSPVVSHATKDVVGMLEAMHETHTNDALPAVARCRTVIEEFARRCVAAKNALATEAIRTLRTIAAEQSKIRQMKEALAPFPAALDRQEAHISRLLVVRRLPIAYKHALAECVRRTAFSEKYASFAADLAERMGHFRDLEWRMRGGFQQRVGGILPAELLTAMGLDAPPPHCEVNVPTNAAEHLVGVTVDDVQQLQLPYYYKGAMTATQMHMPEAQSYFQRPEGGQASTNAKLRSEPKTDEALRIENVRLRSELASHIALECIKIAKSTDLRDFTASPPVGSTYAAGASPTASAESSETTSQSGHGGAFGADAAQKFERALAAKDALVAAIRKEAVDAKAREAALHAKVVELEARLEALPGSSASKPLHSPEGQVER